LPSKRFIDASRTAHQELPVAARAAVNPAANLSHPFQQQKQQGRCAMAKIEIRYLPRGNPCAQCSTPIAAPDWIESGPRRASYLWHCKVCDYRFEAVAFFQDSETDRLAA
jgi:hypothetical protein